MSIRCLRCSNSATNMADEFSKSDLRSSPAVEAASSNSMDPYLRRSHHRRRETPPLPRQDSLCTGAGQYWHRTAGFEDLMVRSSSDEPRFINTVTFDGKDDSPMLVMVHGYAAPHGFFFRNFDVLVSRFGVIAIDQLGWGGSSRPGFTCKSTEETEAWFIDSFEEWRKANNIMDFILLGHYFGGYVAAKYALKHPEHVKHLILVGSARFSSESDSNQSGSCDLELLGKVPS